MAVFVPPANSPRCGNNATNVIVFEVVVSGEGVGAMASRAVLGWRRGKVLDPLFEPPDVVGSDLREVAGRILEAEIDRA
jgi:hypothetical protein